MVKTRYNASANAEIFTRFQTMVGKGFVSANLEEHMTSYVYGIDNKTIEAFKLLKKHGVIPKKADFDTLIRTTYGTEIPVRAVCKLMSTGSASEVVRMFSSKHENAIRNAEMELREFYIEG